MGRAIIIFFALVCAVAVIAANRTPTRSNAGTAENAGLSKDSSAAPHDIMQDEEFLSGHPDFPETMRGLVLLAGYQCPRINILWVRGQTPYGRMLEAFCGPPSGAGIYDAQHYAIYPEQFRVKICGRNGILHNGCDSP